MIVKQFNPQSTKPLWCFFDFIASLNWYRHIDTWNGKKNKRKKWDFASTNKNYGKAVENNSSWCRWKLIGFSFCNFFSEQWSCNKWRVATEIDGYCIVFRWIVMVLVYYGVLYYIFLYYIYTLTSLLSKDFSFSYISSYGNGVMWFVFEQVELKVIEWFLCEILLGWGIFSWIISLYSRFVESLKCFWSTVLEGNVLACRSEVFDITADLQEVALGKISHRLQRNI